MVVILWLYIYHTYAAQYVLGDHHACLVSPQGEVWCWGLNAQGQLGDGTLDVRAVPVHVMDDATRIGAGVNHTCALKNNGLLWCWGDNKYGQVDPAGDPGSVLTPRELPALPPARDLALGAQATCILPVDDDRWICDELVRPRQPGVIEGQPSKSPCQRK